MLVKQGKKPTGKIEDVGHIKDKNTKQVKASINWEKPKEKTNDNKTR